MFLPMAMFFYILFYVSMPFNEERTEFKKMQPISPFIYWTSVYLFDAMIHIMYSYFIYLVHIWCDTHQVFETKEYSNFILLFLLFNIEDNRKFSFTNFLFILNLQLCLERFICCMVLLICQSFT